METEEVEYKSAGEFLVGVKREFGGEDKEVVKVAELRKLEQRGRTMEEFVQEFRRIARGSRYEGAPLLKNSREA